MSITATVGQLINSDIVALLIFIIVFMVKSSLLCIVSVQQRKQAKGHKRPFRLLRFALLCSLFDSVVWIITLFNRVDIITLPRKALSLINQSDWALGVLLYASLALFMEAVAKNRQKKAWLSDPIGSFSILDVVGMILRLGLIAQAIQIITIILLARQPSSSHFFIANSIVIGVYYLYSMIMVSSIPHRSTSFKHAAYGLLSGMALPLIVCLLIGLVSYTALKFTFIDQFSVVVNTIEGAMRLIPCVEAAIFYFCIKKLITFKARFSELPTDPYNAV